MALTNSQYDAVMREYDEIRERHRHETDEHREELYRKIPELKSLDDQVVSCSMEAAKMRLRNPGCSLTSYHSRLKDIAAKKSALIRAAGYPDDYAEMKYDCPFCHDTGVYNGAPCVCFEKRAAEYLYGGKSLMDAVKRENFDTFSFDWYSDKISDESAGESPLSSAETAYHAARSLTQHIGDPDANLYIYGSTGVGKTFLTHCIAGAALEGGYGVLKFSAGELFDRLADSAFARGAGGEGRKLISECDLLIIDDLGTELVNSFRNSELFRLINTRIDENRSTVISSNLKPREIRELYSERISSRITGHYTIVHMCGEDIRVQKALR